MALDYAIGKEEEEPGKKDRARKRSEDCRFYCWKLIFTLPPLMVLLLLMLLHCFLLGLYLYSG